MKWAWDNNALIFLHEAEENKALQIQTQIARWKPEMSVL